MLQDSTELVCLSFTPGNEQGSREASHMFRAGLLVLLVSFLFCFVLFSSPVCSCKIQQEEASLSNMPG